MRWLGDEYEKVFALHFKLAFGCHGASFPIRYGMRITKNHALRRSCGNYEAPIKS